MRLPGVPVRGSVSVDSSIKVSQLRSSGDIAGNTFSRPFLVTSASILYDNVCRYLSFLRKDTSLACSPPAETLSVDQQSGMALPVVSCNMTARHTFPTHID